MLRKIYITIMLFLILNWGFTYWRKNTLENDLTSLKKDYSNLENSFKQSKEYIKFLEKDIDERNKKSLETSERVREIEKQAEKTKNNGGFDWNSPLPDDTVTKQLRKN